MKVTITVECLGCTCMYDIDNPNALETFQGQVLQGTNNLNRKRMTCNLCKGNVFKVVNVNVIA